MNNEIKQDLSDDNPKPENKEPSLEDYDYPDGYVPQKAGKAAMIVAISAAAVITLAVAGFFVYLFFFSNNDSGESKEPVRPTAEVTTAAPAESTVPTMTANAAEKLIIMPDLSGLTEREAYESLNNEGIRYKVNREFSDEVPAGYIITQSPWPYEEVHRSREAIIYISKGGENEIFTSPRSNTETTGSDDSTEPSKKPKGDDDEYILPDSDSNILTEDDLEPLDEDTLNLALNEIFARHGRIFSDPDIKSYFESKSWYSGTVSADDFDESVFNSHEIYNINLITSYQEQMGYR